MFDASASLALVFALAAAYLVGGDVPVAPEAPTEHCVLFVVDQKPDGEFVMAGPDCFTDEQTAEWWAQTAGSGISGSPSVFTETTSQNLSCARSRRWRLR
jgi:hypothetical protein